MTACRSVAVRVCSSPAACVPDGTCVSGTVLLWRTHVTPADYAEVQVRRLVLMSVCQDDWAAAEECQAMDAGRVVVGFGVHPWRAHQYASRSTRGVVGDVLEGDVAHISPEQLAAPLRQGWKPALRARLKRFPTAVVGECGLDRAARVPGTSRKTKLEHQLALLREQLEIAGEFHRAVRRCAMLIGFGFHSLLSLPKEATACAANSHLPSSVQRRDAREM